MKKFSASGAIGLLITLIIIAIAFILTIPSIKSSTTTKIETSPIKHESIEDEVNQKLNEIQNIRNQAIEQQNAIEY